MDKRTPRESETREATSRKKSWAPPTVLPEPTKKDGWRYRWIRTSTLNSNDNTNVSSKFRQGWEPVRAEEHPEITVLRDRKSDFLLASHTGSGKTLAYLLPIGGCVILCACIKRDPGTHLLEWGVVAGQHLSSWATPLQLCTTLSRALPGSI